MSGSGAARWLAAVAGIAVVGGLAIGLARNQVDKTVDEDGVDAGFARDMAFHHAQAVQMGSYALAFAPTDDVRALASSIAVQQQVEIGQMLGWLQAWGLPRMSPHPAMAWMTDQGTENHGHHMSGSTMPGMATPAEMDALVNMTGKKLEVRFLQLMIRHHQGGLPMAMDAARRASLGYVRNLANQMAIAQREEIDRMRQLLTDRGGTELPAP